MATPSPASPHMAAGTPLGTRYQAALWVIRRQRTCLSRSSFGSGQHVIPRHDPGQRLRLDLSEVREAHGGNRLLTRRRYRQRREANRRHMRTRRRRRSRSGPCIRGLAFRGRRLPGIRHDDVIVERRRTRPSRSRAASASTMLAGVATGSLDRRLPPVPLRVHRLTGPCRTDSVADSAAWSARNRRL